MKHKISVVLLIVSAVLVLMAFAPRVSSQTYGAVKIQAYGEGVDDDEVNGELEFIVVFNAAVNASIAVDIDNDGVDDIYTQLSEGDHVFMTYNPSQQGIQRVLTLDTEDPLMDKYTILWEGSAESIELNTVEIPEFPTWMPILGTVVFATILVALFKRKLKAQA